MQRIKDRYKKQQKYLKILKPAFNGFAMSDRASAYLDGRIREVESEIAFLREIIDDNTH